MKNNKNRITLGILLGTIGIFGVGLYLREHDKVKKEEKRKEKKKKEVVVREDTNAESTHNIKRLCISILKSENPPTNPSEFLRELVGLGMLGGDKLLEKLPRTISEMEDMLAEFKIYREYSRRCYSKLGEVEKSRGEVIVLGKI